MLVKASINRVRFDDTKVLDWIDRRQAQAMNRVGATIRLIARRSIRKAPKRGNYHEPGKPPRFRRRGQCSLKDGIFYSFDRQSRQLVVGPILCSNQRSGGKTVPEALEFGSSENRAFPFMNPAWLQAVQRDEVKKAMEAF